jgi:hypothetical protein
LSGESLISLFIALSSSSRLLALRLRRLLIVIFKVDALEPPLELGILRPLYELLLELPVLPLLLLLMLLLAEILVLDA